MDDTFNASTSADALAKDLAELRQRVLNDPATRTLTVLGAVGAVAGVAVVARTLIRKRRLIRNLLMVGSTIATITQLRDRIDPTWFTRSGDGPPPPPAAPSV